ncbi:hypothetical protein F5Y19DRAFT_327619 [Xylariaceae sp. FL1651]|nr:hypothetical protein F5Y19DRAFT_327619 [Xylariaceae sp. FL1651]
MMSVEIWPPIAPEQLIIEEDATQARELTWLLASLQTTLLSLKHGLEDCYALLAPIDPGSTLVLSTPRAELVKGHVTRVGARLVKGTIHTRLRTTTPLTLSINPARPVHLAPLVTLNTLLTQAVDLASLCLSEGETEGKQDCSSAASFLSSQLRLLAQHLAEACAILKGSPSSVDESKPALSSSSRAGMSRPSTADPSTATTNYVGSISSISGNDWTQTSAASTSFTPPLGHTLSFHVTIEDASLVLHLRALEPADAPVNLGIKLALAIGTARRLEHDEADKVFAYHYHEADPLSLSLSPSNETSTAATTQISPPEGRPRSEGEPRTYPTSGSRALMGGSRGMGAGGGGDEMERVYVREKVRVASADPSLLSMSAKLSALSNTLNLTRRNLAAVMGEELEE